MNTQIYFHNPITDDKKVKIEIDEKDGASWGNIILGKTLKITMFDTPDEICEWLACLGAEITTALTWYQSEADICKPHGNPAETQYSPGGVPACSKQCAKEQVE